MAVVVFDIAAFREAYPQFTVERITGPQLQEAFNVACLLWNNTDASTVPVEERSTQLNLLVCHLATLALWGAKGQAGPVSSESAGTSSLSVSFQIPQQIGRKFYAQTPCGNAFWQATLQYRAGGKYYPPANNFHPWG
jgi:hypothetical protein